MKTSLEQWRALQAVVDQGGYAQAASHLNRSQSSVSYAVARLQERLGLSLLELDGRRARLTVVGEALLKRADHLLQAASELEDFALGLEQGWEAEIRLVVDAAFPVHRLTQALAHFAPVGRGTRVQMSEVVLSGAEEALLNREADLAITGLVPRGMLGDPLMTLEFLAVAARGHPLHTLGRELLVSDLEKALQVVISDSGLARRRDMGWLGAEHRWAVSSIATAVEVVRAGLGFAWLPRHAIREALDSGELMPLPLREGGFYPASLYLVQGARREPGPATRLLARLLRESVLTA